LKSIPLLFLHLLWYIFMFRFVLQVVGKLIVIVGITCFENVCAKYLVPTLTNGDNDSYCYICKCIVSIETQPCISCKIRKDIGED
jgi:hypothetical protein